MGMNIVKYCIQMNRYIIYMHESKKIKANIVYKLSLYYNKCSIKGCIIVINIC